MKVLFATTNPAKVKKYEEALAKNDIELITLKDLDIQLNIDENGRNTIENAYIKAKAYYDATGITTIGMDNSLYIEGLPDEKQPGTHVRRVNGKYLNDDEMIEYYTSLVKEYGGKLTAKWIFGMVIYDEEGAKEYSWTKSNFYFTDQPCKKRIIGYPLDSISVMPENNKFYLDLTEEEKQTLKDKNEKENKSIEFMVHTLKEKENRQS